MEDPQLTYALINCFWSMNDDSRIDADWMLEWGWNYAKFNYFFQPQHS